jgi:hypothetical protein
MKITEKIENRIVENVKSLTSEDLEQEFIYFSIKNGNKLKQKVTPAQNKNKDTVHLHIWEHTEDLVVEIKRDIYAHNELDDCDGPLELTKCIFRLLDLK